MKLNNAKSRWQLLSALSVLLLTLIMAASCGGDDSGSDEDGDNAPKTCITHADCPELYSCLVADGVCGTDPQAIQCYDVADCTDGYCCYIASDSIDNLGKCVPDDGSVSCGGGTDGDNADGDKGVPDSCKEDSDCNDPNYVCCDNKCEERNRYCDNIRDCLNGQRCEDGVCTGEPQCGEEDGDEDTVDPDIEEAAEADPDPDPDNVGGCERSSDCPEGQICGPGGVCGPRCDAAGQSCPAPQTCNPNNGMCECCENDCEAGRCCNRSQGFWYCGQCCTPPCPTGQACQAGQCVALTCPECDQGQSCEDSNPCKVCVDDEPDGDTDGTKEACLPANSACQEGVDNCCSGTCMMGTCL